MYLKSMLSVKIFITVLIACNNLEHWIILNIILT